MTFVDPFLLATTLVLTIVLIIANLYFLAYFSHHADNGFGSSTACKFIIVSKTNYNSKDAFIHGLPSINSYAPARCNEYKTW